MEQLERQTILSGLYEEVGKNFRHFLAWRRFLFAGYFGIMAGLANVFDWKNLENIDKNGIVLFMAVIITLLFWSLDLRNRKLIRNASDAGEYLERELDLGGGGCYSIYKSEKDKLTHSLILTSFYWVSILGYTAWFVVLVLL